MNVAACNLQPNYQRSRVMRKLGLTITDYHTTYSKQLGKCTVCDTWYSKLVIDHCHVTNKFRGLLCRSCNAMLGMAKDNPDTLLRALQYLIRTKVLGNM
jgi:hypothetical protein